MGSEGIFDKYINPYTDFGFKMLFGTDLNKDILISFLNALLHGKEVIRDVTYMNTEHLGTQELDRRAVFDVYCVNDKGERFIVEMQKGEQRFFRDRSIYYATYPIREQAPKGVWDYELKGVYTICILNFTFPESDGEVIQTIQLMNTRTHKVFYDKLSFIYLEMPKFNKEVDELDGMLDKWLFVLKNLARLMSRPEALQERVFTKLFAAAEIASFDRKERVAYEESLKNYRDWYSLEQTALWKGEVKGRAKGLAEGREEGRKEEKYKIAATMKALGMQSDLITKATGLTTEEIDEIK